MAGKDAARGAGFTIVFRWTNVTGAESYQVVARAASARYAVVDVAVKNASHTDRNCNSFVIDRNRLDWSWTVRAIFPDGSTGAWSTRSPFEFLPCRLDDGHPCHAPP